MSLLIDYTSPRTVADHTYGRLWGRNLTTRGPCGPLSIALWPWGNEMIWHCHAVWCTFVSTLRGDIKSGQHCTSNDLCMETIQLKAWSPHCGRIDTSSTFHSVKTYNGIEPAHYFFVSVILYTLCIGYDIPSAGRVKEKPLCATVHTAQRTTHNIWRSTTGINTFRLFWFRIQLRIAMMRCDGQPGNWPIHISFNMQISQFIIICSFVHQLALANSSDNWWTKSV